MVSSRLKILTISVLCVIFCGIMTSSAFAGTLVSNPSVFALEALAANGTTAVTNLNQVYTMGISFTAQADFVITFTLANGTFAALPAVTNASYTFLAPIACGGGGNSVATITYRNDGGGVGQNFVDYNVDLSCGGAIGDTFTLPAPQVFFGSVALNNSITISAQLKDNFGNIDTGGGPLTRTLSTINSVASFTATTDSGNVTIDATNASGYPTPYVSRTAFVFPGGDATSSTVIATPVTTTKTVAGILVANGTANYTLLASDQITFKITGDFTGIQQAGFDLDANGTITVAAGNTATNEAFTIDPSLTFATLTVNGNRFQVGGSKIIVTKTAGAVLTPRTWGISASEASTLAGLPVTPSIPTANANWWVWGQNGTTLTAPYVTFNNTVPTKFRFTNSSQTAVTILAVVTPDSGSCTVSAGGGVTGITVTGGVLSFTIPASGSVHVELTAGNDASNGGALPSAGGSVGPLCSAFAPVANTTMRGKVVFTALTAKTNVNGVYMVTNTANGITIFEGMPQQ